MVDRESIKYFIPAILVISLVFLYIFFSYVFIAQKFGEKKQVDGTLISVVDKNKQKSIPDAAAELKPTPTPTPSPSPTATATATATPTTSNTNAAASNSNVNISSVIAQIDELKKEADKLPESNVIKNIDKLKKEVSNEPATATPKPVKTPKKAAVVSSEDDDDDTANVKLSPEEKAKNELRSSISKRYSSRASWVLLTTLLFALMFGIVGFTCYVLTKALKDLSISMWIVITFVAALLALILGYNNQLYMPVVGQMYADTIYTYEFMDNQAFSFYNAIIFFVIVFLVATSCAIYYQVRKLNTDTKDLPQERKEKRAKLDEILEKASDDTQTLTALEIAEKDKLLERLKVIDKKLSGYEQWRDYSKYLLYLGGAMLTVGLMRVNVLAGWHTAFVESGSVKLLQDFFDSSLNNQAVFYTILLMAIYLPISFILPDTAVSPAVEDSFKRKGFFATLMAFAPQLFTLLSPALASTFSDLFGLFFGK
jgi:hypothetical protein